MNEKYFTDAVSEDTVYKLTEHMLDQGNRSGKVNFKPSKIISAAAAVALLISFFNITTVIAFFKDMLYAPVIGFTDDPGVSVSYSESPVDFQINHGLITLDSACKVSKDGESVVLLMFSSKNIPASLSSILPIKVSASADGKNFNITTSGSTGGAAGSLYEYMITDYDDSDYFTLTVNGVSAEIKLISQTLKYAGGANRITIGGVTLAMEVSQSNVTRAQVMLYIEGLDTSQYFVSYYGSGTDGSAQFIAEDGSELPLTGGGGGMFYDWNAEKSPLNGIMFNQLYFKNPENKKMAAFHTDSLLLRVSFRHPELNGFSVARKVELPIPEDGESIDFDFKIDVAGHEYAITRVWREGDTVYYEDNIKDNWEKCRGAAYGYQATAEERKEAAEKALKNNEAFIVYAWSYFDYSYGLIPFSDEEYNVRKKNIEYNNYKRAITGDFEGLDCLPIDILSMEIVYFGNWDLYFD